MKQIKKSTILISLATVLFIVSVILAVIDVSGWGWFLFIGFLSFSFYMDE